MRSINITLVKSYVKNTFEHYDVMIIKFAYCKNILFYSQQWTNLPATAAYLKLAKHKIELKNINYNVDEKVYYFTWK